MSTEAVTETASAKPIDQPALDALIEALCIQDRETRLKARESLVKIGHSAIGVLVKALVEPNDHLRWEAAKALCVIGDPAAAPALVTALEDKEFGVRWLAAEGLIMMGHLGVPALLTALMTRSDSPWLRNGAHHILKSLADVGMDHGIDTVLVALEDLEPALVVPMVARTALDNLATGA